MILVTLTPWCKMVAEAHTHLNRLTAKLGVTWFASKMCQSDQDLEKLFVKTRVVQTLSLWCACCKSLDILIVLISVSILRINNCVSCIGGHLWHRQLVLAALSPGQKMWKEFGRGKRTQAKQKGKARGKKWPILNSREEKQEHLFGIDRTREKETCTRGTTKKRSC